MFVLTVKAKATPEDCNELLQSLRSMREHVRKMDGCLSCECYKSIEDNNDIYFVERWATQKDLSAHMRSDLYSAIQGAFKVLTACATVEMTSSENNS